MWAGRVTMAARRMAALVPPLRPPLPLRIDSRHPPCITPRQASLVEKTRLPQLAEISYQGTQPERDNVEGGFDDDARRKGDTGCWRDRGFPAHGRAAMLRCRHGAPGEPALRAGRACPRASTRTLLALGCRRGVTDRRRLCAPRAV